jgi:hypothetical protein
MAYVQRKNTNAEQINSRLLADIPFCFCYLLDYITNKSIPGRIKQGDIIRKPISKEHFVEKLSTLL